MSESKLKAAIFDLDGVITDTASLHARAWEKMFNRYNKLRRERGDKTYRKFSIANDYHKYIDGMPRYDGVGNFLKSRGIKLPKGSNGDKSGKETICGLGNQKNEIYLEIMEEEGVQVIRPNVETLKKWRKAGMKTAIISSSKNCRNILKAAGLENLFDVRVDGVVSEERHLKGKPEPDIFIAAANELGFSPDESLIVEDSLAGIEAGHNGHFAELIGIADGSKAKKMKAKGATRVVKNLSELSGEIQPSVKSPAELPDAIENFGNISQRWKGKRIFIFLDYDGTLTPIVREFDKAFLSEEMKKQVRDLSGFTTVSIVSGRGMDDVRERVALDNIYYAGSHGFEIYGPGDFRHEVEAAAEKVPVLDKTEKEIRKQLGTIKGVKFERKKFALAVHYREVAKNRINTVRKRMNDILKDCRELTQGRGKKVIEVKPAIYWNKGKAIRHLLSTLNEMNEPFEVLYIGDDITDEDAFMQIVHGAGILVGSHGEKSFAGYRLGDVRHVHQFLGMVNRYFREHDGDRWKIIYNNYVPEDEPTRESLCALGNGYFVTRGVSEESVDDGVHYPGTYLAGGYDRLKTRISGQIIENEDLVNWPNWLLLKMKIGNGNWIRLEDLDILEYNQILDLRNGILERKVRWKDEKKHETAITCRRFVSMRNPHRCAVQWEVTPENWSGKVTVHSAIDGTVINNGVPRYRDLNSKHLEIKAFGPFNENKIFMTARSVQSGIVMAQTARTELYFNSLDYTIERRNIEKKNYVAQELEFTAKKKEKITVEKIATIFTSRDNAISNPEIAAKNEIQRVGRFNEMLKMHSQAWKEIWRRCDTIIDVNPENQRMLRLHLFHLFQTTSVHTIDNDAGVPPRGWHGEAYRGHILWDELFIFPFLNMSFPEVTRALLMYRYRRLSEARYGARAAGYKGAMYPWQSGSDGREESQRIHLNPQSGRWIPDDSRLQRHVNATIAYNIWQYYQMTRDAEFLKSYGTEMLLEIARFWISAAQFNKKRGKYEIHKVVGPDEYHTRYPDADEPGLKNNAFTNVMAVWTILHAMKAFYMQDEIRREELLHKLDMHVDEFMQWELVTGKMYLPFLNRGRIISQFEGFEHLEELDWDRYHEKYGEILRLDRILEEENDSVNRYKAVKQADVLMLFYLFSVEELSDLILHMGYKFKPSLIPDTIEYYRRRTSHGSTLSKLIHSWVVARSNRELSWENFEEALVSDFRDIQGGTTREGIHLGAMAGTVDLIRRCYTGFEVRNDTLWFNPHLPREINEIRYRMQYRDHPIILELSRNELKLTSYGKWQDDIKVNVIGKTYTMNKGQVRKFRLKDAD